MSENTSTKRKKALVIRLGAFGDMVIITPALTRLKELGYYVILNTTHRGLKIFQGDSRIDEFIEHDESMPVEKVAEHWDKQKEDIQHDYYVNFSESIECNLALHPTDPSYNYSKQERAERCNRNYYDVSNEWAHLSGCDKRPSLQFDKETEKKAKKYIKKGFNVLWCLSGSGHNKTYPWTDYIIGDMLKNYPDTHILFVGNDRCQLLQTYHDKRITNLSGELDIKTSMCLTKHVDLVISPDTGILHASGCFSTPKIGLLGHTTKENITKYFENDYSIEADCSCAPCFRLIYDFNIQCPIEPVTHAAWCQAVGLRPERVYEQYEKVRKNAKRNL